MDTTLLTQLHNRLQATPGLDLALGPALIQTAAITDNWQALFGNDTLRLSGAALQPLDPSGNFFRLQGTTNLLGLQNLQVLFTFFVAHDSTAPTDDAVHCLIAPLNAPATWNVTTGYPDLPGYINYAPDKIALGRQQSFFQQIQFQQFTLLYSSYDFYQADLENRLSPPAHLTTSLAAPPQLQGALLRAGANFSAVVALVGDFWSTLTQIRPGLNQISTLGAIQAGDLGPMLQIGHSFADPTSGQYPAIDLLPGGKVQASLRQLLLQTGLTPGSDIPPGMALLLRVGCDALALDLTLDLPVGSSSLMLLGMFEDGKVITLDAIESALGLPDLETFLPDPLDFFGTLGLQFIRAELSLSPLELTELTVGITTEYPWTVIDDLMWVQPTLTFQVSYVQGQPTVSLDLVGDWQVGATHFDMYVSTETGDVGAQLALGETLVIGELFTELFPGMEQPDFQVLDLELTGNYKQKSIAFEVEAGGPWSFDVGGKPIVIDDVLISGSYEGADGEDDAPAFTGSVVGTLTVAGWMITVDVELGQQLSMEVTIPELSVSDLVDEFLQAVHIPYQMPTFNLQDFDIKMVPKTGEFAIRGGSTDVIDIVKGFDFTLSHFEAQCDAAQNQAARLDLLLQLGTVSATCSASYTVKQQEIQGGTAPAKEWVFSVAPPDQAIPVGHLLAKLQAMVGLSYPLPVDAINLRDFYLSFNLGTENRYFVLTSTIVDGDTEWGKVSLVATKTDTPAQPAATWDFAFSAQVDLNIALADLPVVGPDLAAVAAMQLHGVQFTVASRDYSQPEVDRLLQLLPESAVRPPAQAIGKAPTFQALLQSGGSDLVMAVPIQTKNDLDQPDPPHVPPDPDTRFQPAPPMDKTQWFPVHKSFRAVTLDRVGLRFQNSALLLLLDGSVLLGPLRLELLGLGAGSALTQFKPVFNLDGLSLGYESGPLQISGGFLHAGTDRYAGEVRLQAPALSLTALGQYASVGGHPSLFVFGLLAEPLGGPPYFFVQGLAAGLGYNSQLRLPTITTLPAFSLVQAVLPDKSAIQPTDDPGTVLRTMGSDVQPQPGEYWLAAGVRFGTYEQLQSFALVTAQFAQKLEVALLGVSQLAIPAAAPSPIAYAELTLEAAIDPEQGCLAVDAALAPSSYVLSHQCRLSGGFSFRAWFSGEQKDDFVVTLGGYHPHFTIPPHYPQPARLGLSWQVSDELGIKGSMYFALTPQAIMAGGVLEAVWQSGDIRAWFTAQADFLLYWKPFRYEAELSISIGASLRLDLLFTSVTITVHVGVDLSLYGPDFGGEAHIDLDIVSFTIGFGAGRPNVAPILWPEFKSTFLPSPGSAAPARAVLTALAEDPVTPTNTICRVTVAGGMVRDLTKDKTYQGDLQWVINPEKLVLTTNAALPAQAAYLNGQAQSPPDSKQAWPTSFGVVPMGLAPADFTANHRIQLAKFDAATKAYAPYDNWALTPVRRHLPGSLWAYTGNAQPGLGDPAQLENALVGFTIVPQATKPDVTRAVDLQKLQYTASNPVNHFTWPAAPAPAPNPFDPQISADGSTLTFTAGGQARTNHHFVLSAVLDPDAQAQRTAMIAAMQARGLAVDAGVDLKRLGTDTMLTDWPAVRLLGDMP